MTRGTLILIQTIVARIACKRRTANDLRALRDNITQAARMPARVGWKDKATAHADFHTLLADATGNPVLAVLVRSIADTLRDLLQAVGPSAEASVTGAHRRLLRHLTDRDAGRAAQEMEQHLQHLYDLGQRHGQATVPRRSDRAAGDQAAG
jgi:GntR family transcriptional regulator, transcriptional repressor for pyruvate dehydrogenase complex